MLRIRLGRLGKPAIDTLDSSIMKKTLQIRRPKEKHPLYGLLVAVRERCFSFIQTNLNSLIH